MNRKELKQAVFEANLDLPKLGLVKHTWGNVSQIDRERGEVAIKPSGVEYEGMTAEDIVIVDLEGKVIDGKLNPSSDLATHLRLYEAFACVGGIAHTHSTYATSFAQALREIPCQGTTHADTFYGAVPLTRAMRPEEILADYEANTGGVIAERFAAIDPAHMPGVLVAGHGPFTWGKDAADAVYASSVLEETAKMAFITHALGGTAEISLELLNKHFFRKHGKDAYYGQK